MPAPAEAPPRDETLPDLHSRLVPAPELLAFGISRIISQFICWGFFFGFFNCKKKKNHSSPFGPSHLTGGWKSEGNLWQSHQNPAGMEHVFSQKSPWGTPWGRLNPPNKICTVEEGGKGSKGEKRMIWSCFSMGQEMLSGILSLTDSMEPKKSWLHPKLFATLNP